MELDYEKHMVISISSKYTQILSSNRRPCYLKYPPLSIFVQDAPKTFKTLQCLIANHIYKNNNNNNNKFKKNPFNTKIKYIRRNQVLSNYLWNIRYHCSWYNNVFCDSQITGEIENYHPSQFLKINKLFISKNMCKSQNIVNPT